MKKTQMLRSYHNAMGVAGWDTLTLTNDQHRHYYHGGTSSNEHDDSNDYKCYYHC